MEKMIFILKLLSKHNAHIFHFSIEHKVLSIVIAYHYNSAGFKFSYTAYMFYISLPPFPPSAKTIARG